MFEPGPYGRAKNVLTHRAKRGQKKKHTAMFGLYVRTEFCIFFLAPFGPSLTQAQFVQKNTVTWDRGTRGLHIKRQSLREQ